MEESLLRALIANGGFAVLAAFLGLLAYKMWQQAQAILNRVLDLVREVSAAQATLTSAITALSGEVAGLRTGIHGVRDLMVVFEARLHELEKRSP